jgi:hypothetical protein
VIAQHVEPYRDDADNRLREDGPTYDLGAEQLPASSFQ